MNSDFGIICYLYKKDQYPDTGTQKYSPKNKNKDEEILSFDDHAVHLFI
jgi:hypothetical protein